MTERECKHNKGFKFFACTAADRLPGVWACSCHCGYVINFNPEDWDGIAYVDRNNSNPMYLDYSKH